MDKPQAQGRRPNKHEFVDRLARCRQLIGLGYHDGEIKSIMAGEFGLSPKSVPRYLLRAREEIREDLDQSRDDQRADALEVYRAIILDEDTPVRDRIKARERMDKILGLDAPVKTADVSRMTEAQLEEQERRLGIEPPKWELPTASRN